MFNTSFENSKRALFREQKEDKHPTHQKFAEKMQNSMEKLKKSEIQLFNREKMLTIFG